MDTCQRSLAVCVWRLSAEDGPRLLPVPPPHSGWQSKTRSAPFKRRHQWAAFLSARFWPSTGGFCHRSKPRVKFSGQMHRFWDRRTCIAAPEHRCENPVATPSESEADHPVDRGTARADPITSIDAGLCPGLRCVSCCWERDTEWLEGVVRNSPVGQVGGEVIRGLGAVFHEETLSISGSASIMS